MNGMSSTRNVSAATSLPKRAPPADAPPAGRSMSDGFTPSDTPSSHTGRHRFERHLRIARMPGRVACEDVAILGLRNEDQADDDRHARDHDRIPKSEIQT